MLQRAKKNVEAGEDEDDFRANSKVRIVSSSDTFLYCLPVLIPLFSVCYSLSVLQLVFQDLWLKQLDSLRALQMPVIENDACMPWRSSKT